MVRWQWDGAAGRAAPPAQLRLAGASSGMPGWLPLGEVPGREIAASADPGSARRFGRCWRLVRPFVGHIMRATLVTLRRDAEQPDRPAPRASGP